MRKLSLVALAALLVSCGGGGGTNPSPAVSNPNSGVPLTVPPPGTVPVSSAAMTFNSVTGGASSAIADANDGSSATITKDDVGNVTSLTLNISTGGITKNMTLVPNGQVQSIGTDQTAFAVAGSLNFSAFGAWGSSEDTAGNFKFGGFAGGQATPVANMPRSGSAIYNGNMLGVATNGTNAFTVAGNAQISADFGAQTVGTNFFNITQQQVGTNTVTPVVGFSGTSQLTGNIYAGPLVSANGLQTGDVRGQFYGPGAQETAGVWRITGQGTTAVGSFGAR
jgi:hypothetical protein